MEDTLPNEDVAARLSEGATRMPNGHWSDYGCTRCFEAWQDGRWRRHMAYWNRETPGWQQLFMPNRKTT